MVDRIAAQATAGQMETVACSKHAHRTSKAPNVTKKEAAHTISIHRRFFSPKAIHTAATRIVTKPNAHRNQEYWWARPRTNTLILVRNSGLNRHV